MASKKVVPINTVEETQEENLEEVIDETAGEENAAINELDEILKEATPVTIHDGVHKKDYTLEFSRETVAFAQARGFKEEEIDTMDMIRVPELFFYAFRMHHSNVSRAETDRILFEDLGGMSPELLQRLTLLYIIPHRTLFNHTGKSKNPRVTVEL